MNAVAGRQARQDVRELASKLQRDLTEQRAAERRVTVAVQLLRARGCSWSFIGTLLGVSRQAARQKYAPQELV